MKQYVKLFEQFKEELNEKNFNHLRWRWAVTADWKYAGKIDRISNNMLAIELNAAGYTVNYKPKDVYIIDMDEDDIVDIMFDHIPPGEDEETYGQDSDKDPIPMPKENKAYFSKYFKGKLVNALTIKEDYGSFEDIIDINEDNNSLEDLNEAKTIRYKRKYTDKHPEKRAGLHGRVRDRVLEVMADKKMTQVEFDKIVQEFNLSKRWVRNNSHLFKVKGGMVALSETGRRIWNAKSKKVNEAKHDVVAIAITKTGEVEFTRDDIQEMLDDLTMYMGADNLPKWLMFSIYGRNKKQNVENILTNLLSHKGEPKKFNVK